MIWIIFKILKTNSIKILYFNKKRIKEFSIFKLIRLKIEDIIDTSK